MLTNGFSLRRRRRRALSTTLNQVYQGLAQASGGQAIEVTKGTLAQATGIIAVTTRSTLVNKSLLWTTMIGA